MTCRRCRREIVGKRSDARYCSDICRSAAWDRNNPNQRPKRRTTARDTFQRSSENGIRVYLMPDELDALIRAEPSPTFDRAQGKLITAESRLISRFRQQHERGIA